MSDVDGTQGTTPPAPDEDRQSGAARAQGRSQRGTHTLKVPSRRRTPGEIARWPIITFVVVGALIGCSLLGGATGRKVPAAQTQSVLGPKAAPANAISSGWYCAGATDSKGGAAPSRLVLTNAGTNPVSAAIRLIGNGGQSSDSSVQVPADSRVSVNETMNAKPDWIGAIVDLSGGQTSVEQVTSSTAYGTSATPCASAGSTGWYFGTGQTLINATSEILVVNPYPSYAVASLQFTTNQGPEQPSGLQDLTVPPGQMIAIPIRDYLRRRTAIATSVTTSHGQVVAFKTDVTSTPPAHAPILGTKAARAANADPASPDVGASVVLGASSLADKWYWPAGGQVSGSSERFVVYNPGTKTANVSMAVNLDAGQAEPFTVSLGPSQVTTLSTANEARIPQGVGYSVRISSTNGVPVMAERTVTANPGSSPGGFGEQVGAAQSAPEWLLGASSDGRTTDEIVSVLNTGPKPVSVTLSRLTSSGLQSFPGVGPLVLQGAGKHGSRRSWNLVAIEKHFNGPVVVKAQGGDVVVGRSILSSTSGGQGISLSLGVPLP